MSLGDFSAGWSKPSRSAGSASTSVRQPVCHPGRAPCSEAEVLTTFTFLLPTPNLPDQRTWTCTVNDPAYPAGRGEISPKPKDVIYTVNADLTARRSTPRQSVAPGALQHVPGTPDGRLAGRDGYNQRLIGSLWNIFDLDQIYWFDATTQSRVSMTFGKSKHPMRVDMEKIIGKAPAICVQVYQSEPVAAENRAYFVDG